MIEPRDDRAHEVGPDPAWSESYYFNFFDPGSGIGGFTRIGIRPNEGYADGNLLLFLPDGGAVAVLNREERRANSDLVRVGSVSYERVEDLARWRVVCGGAGLAFPDAADFDFPPRARSGEGGRGATGRVVEVGADLDFVAAMPPFGTSGRRRRSAEAAAAARAVAAGHFEQMGTLRGHLRIGDERVSIDGLGVRDKSWGPRDWSAPWAWRWFSMPFGPDLALGVHSILLAGREVQAGWAWREGRTTKMAGFSLETTYEGAFHRSLVIEAADVEGERYRIRGEVRSVIPLRQGATRIHEGLTTFSLEDRECTGIAEYLDNTRSL